MPIDFSSFMLSCTEESDPTEIQALVQMVKMRDYGKLSFLPTIVSAATVNMDDKYLQTIPGESLKKIPKEDLRIAQEEDSDIGEVKKLVESGEKPVHKVRKGLTPPGRHLVRAWSKLMVGEDGILRRTVKQPSGEICHQIILPKKYRPIVMEELHVNMGHLGAEKVTTLAQDRFYWPNMSSDIEHFVGHQCKCLKDKPPNRRVEAPLQPITTTYPFEMVSIDFLHLETCKGGYQYILVVVDHFTRFAAAYAATNKSGRTAADKIFNDFVLTFGFPDKIHHDQGREFENHFFKHLQRISRIKHSRTTPYHPQGNGQCERMNRTLLGMLRTLTQEQKSDWKRHLKKMVHAYNCSRNESTGYSPYFLVFGRNPRLPIDLIFNINEDGSPTSRASYVEEWAGRPA